MEETTVGSVIGSLEGLQCDCGGRIHEVVLEGPKIYGRRVICLSCGEIYLTVVEKKQDYLARMQAIGVGEA